MKRLMFAVVLAIVAIGGAACDDSRPHRGPEGWIQTPCQPPVGTPDQDCYAPPPSGGAK